MHFLYIRDIILLKTVKSKLLHLLLARFLNNAEIHAIILYKYALCFCQTLLLKIYI